MQVPRRVQREQVGLLAPTLLVILRLIQGFAVAGEISGASSMILEHAPFGRRGFYSSFTLQGVQAGQILAAAVFLPLATPISDAKVLTGRQKPMTEVVMLFAEVATAQGHTGLGLSYSKRAGTVTSTTAGVPFNLSALLTNPGTLPLVGTWENVDAQWPLHLNSGRLRDQWHSMSRTGRIPQLFEHAPLPVLSMHPNDMAARALQLCGARA
mgnify:CR=1 FL=1